MRHHLLSVFLLALVSTQVIPASTASAQLTTGNKFVSASVESDGVISFSDGNSKLISFLHKSFLTLRLGSDVYSNDESLTGAQYPEKYSTSKVGDTITTLWELGSRTVVQRVYPARYQTYGQCVVSVSVVNNGPAIPVLTQYLLDVDVQNDGSPIVTRYGFNHTSQNLGGTGPAVPDYFFATQNDLPPTAAEGFSPGIVAMGQFREPQLGLLPPDQVVTGHWPTFAHQGVGVNYPAGESYSDAAVLEIWNDKQIPSGATVELARTSYGIASPLVCTGNLFAMTFTREPLLFASKPTSASTVDMFLFNTSSQSIMTRLVATLATSAPVALAGAARDTVNTLPPLGMAYLSWPISVATDVPSSGSNFSINVEYQGPQPGFSQLCDGQVRVPPVSSGNPHILSSKATGASDTRLCTARCYEVTVTDDAKPFDGVTDVSLVTSSNMTLNHGMLGAGIDTTTYSLCVTDSLQDASAIVEVSDAAGYAIRTPYNYCTTPDTQDPLVDNVDSSYRGKLTITVADRRAWDRGLDSISIVELRNAQLLAPLIGVHGASSYILSIGVTDPTQPGEVCFKAYDLAGHSTDTKCYSINTVAGVSSIAEVAFRLETYPNPASKLVRVEVQGNSGAEVAVYDVLGNLVATWSLKADDSHELDVSTLPAGTYVVRATNGSTTQSRMVRVIK